jgi:hypothetical protein
MSGAILPLSQYAFMALCSVKKHRDNFNYFTLLYFTLLYFASEQMDNKHSKTKPHLNCVWMN